MQLRKRPPQTTFVKPVQSAVPLGKKPYDTRKNDQNDLIRDHMSMFQSFRKLRAFILDDLDDTGKYLRTSRSLMTIGFDPQQLHVANIGGNPSKWISTGHSKQVVRIGKEMNLQVEEVDALSYLTKREREFQVGIFDACCGLVNICPIVEYYVANNMDVAMNNKSYVWICFEPHRSNRRDQSIKAVSTAEIVEKMVFETLLKRTPFWFCRPTIVYNRADTTNRMWWVAIVFEKAAHPFHRIRMVNKHNPFTSQVVYRKESTNHYTKGIADFDTSMAVPITYSDKTFETVSGPVPHLSFLPPQDATVFGEAIIANHKYTGVKVTKKFLKTEFKGRVERVYINEDGDVTCRVEYDDGDAEDWPEYEVKEIYDDGGWRWPVKKRRI